MEDKKEKKYIKFLFSLKRGVLKVCRFNFKISEEKYQHPNSVLIIPSKLN